MHSTYNRIFFLVSTVTEQIKQKWNGENTFLPTIAVANSYGFSLLFALLLLCNFFFFPFLCIHSTHCIFIEKWECVKFNWIYYVSMKSRIAYASAFLYLSIIFCWFFSRIFVLLQYFYVPSHFFCYWNIHHSLFALRAQFSNMMAEQMMSSVLFFTCLSVRCETIIIFFWKFKSDTS